MDFLNQKSAISELYMLATYDRHAVLINGDVATGKTFLGSQYAKMLSITNTHFVDPKVGEVKEVIEQCRQMTGRILICIENLDSGVVATAYTLLKFLEEPAENVYIVITCRNLYNLPDTIVSRCAVVSIPPMSRSDVVHYFDQNYGSEYASLKSTFVWECIQNISDVDKLVKLDSSKLKYFESVSNAVRRSDSVSSIVWKLQKFDDGSAAPIEIVVKCLMHDMWGTDKWSICHSALQDLYSGRIGVHAILSKMVMQLKYAA